MALGNEVSLVGYCATSPKIKICSNGNKLCQLLIITTHEVFIGNGKKKKYEEKHTCVFFEKNAERAERILMKRSQIHLRGAIHYHVFEQSGRVERIAQIRVEDFELTTQATFTKELYEHIFSGGNNNV